WPCSDPDLPRAEVDPRLRALEDARQFRDRAFAPEHAELLVFLFGPAPMTDQALPLGAVVDRVHAPAELARQSRCADRQVAGPHHLLLRGSPGAVLGGSAAQLCTHAARVSLRFRFARTSASTTFGGTLLTIRRTLALFVLAGERS